MSVVLGPPRLVDVTPGSEEMRHRGRRRASFGAPSSPRVSPPTSVVLIAPLVGILLGAFRDGFPKIGETLTSPDVRHAFFLTFQIAVVTLIVTTTLGAVTAWVLVRHRFIGRRMTERDRRAPARDVPGDGGTRVRAPLRSGRVVRAVVHGHRSRCVFALPSMILVRSSSASRSWSLGGAGARGARHRGGGRGAVARRLDAPDAVPGDPAEHPMGTPLWDARSTTARAIGEFGAVLIVSGLLKGRPRRRRCACSPPSRSAWTRRSCMALTLAAISVLMLAVIEIDKRRKIGGGHGMTRKRPSGSRTSKRFGSFVAVDDITFDAAEGKIRHAPRAERPGKSTVLRMIAGLRAPRPAGYGSRTTRRRSRASRSGGSGSSSSTTRCSAT